MDLNQLLHRHQLSLMQFDRATNPEERLAHSQFARDYAEQIRMVRAELGVPESTHKDAVERDWSNNELEHAVCVTARVVLKPEEKLPYRVVVSRDGEESAGYCFDTMREAEAFIRRNMPAPAPRSTLYDREPDE